MTTRVQRNKNMGKLQAGYLFPEVGRELRSLGRMDTGGAAGRSCSCSTSSEDVYGMGCRILLACRRSSSRSSRLPLQPEARCSM